MLCGLGHHLRYLIVFDALSKTLSSKVGKWLVLISLESSLARIASNRLERGIEAGESINDL
jgi:hypothetical protein